jgi:Cdc6-like AAA superfamily ATPase
VNKIVSVPSQSIVNLTETSERSRLEAERIQEVLILLTSLTAREEATIKLIIDRLYDIGYVNLINKKVGFKPLNSIAKSIAKTSKPIAIFWGWRWFRKNCPQLIARWLYVKVKF